MSSSTASDATIRFEGDFVCVPISRLFRSTDVKGNDAQANTKIPEWLDAAICEMVFMNKNLWRTKSSFLKDAIVYYMEVMRAMPSLNVGARVDRSEVQQTLDGYKWQDEYADLLLEGIIQARRQDDDVAYKDFIHKGQEFVATATNTGARNRVQVRLDALA